MLDDGKAQPRAAQLFGATFLQAIEALEDFLQLVGGNTRARVVHADDAHAHRSSRLDPLLSIAFARHNTVHEPPTRRILRTDNVLRVHLHEHATVFAIVADGVLDQVVDHLLEQGFIAPNDDRFGLEANGHSRIGSQLGQAPHHPTGHLFQIHCLGFVVARRHLVETRKNKHIVDESAHGLGLLVDELRETRHVLRGHQAVGHQLRITGDHLQGRFHLMGDVGREFAAHLLGASQLFVAREGRSRARRLVGLYLRSGYRHFSSFGLAAVA